IGSGGREHAIVRELEKSSKTTAIYVSPGREAFCSEKTKIAHLPGVEQVEEFCKAKQIDFVVIGPEQPLVDGWSDRLRRAGVLVVGPGADGARLEGSKVYSKEFMKKYNIPTASFEVVQSVAEVEAVVDQFSPPYVLKADGLAAGKGVSINKTKEELFISAKELFEDKKFGEAGSSAVLEQFQPGWELSYIGLTNGKTFSALPISQDHKRLQDGDEGPNTGGMGVAGPLNISSDLKLKIESEIVQRTLVGLKSESIDYLGVLYIGLMITESGPRVIEYNVRFGDPETQIILPLTETDWGETFFSLAKGKLGELKQRSGAACCVVLASSGYPATAAKNVEMPVVENLSAINIYCTQALKIEEDEMVDRWWACSKCSWP
ncbi:MAG: phosphoribosylamine--glycine ligase, partial [Bdellovibrionales bacterium]